MFNYMLIEASGVSEPSQIAPLFDLCDDQHNHDEVHKVSISSCQWNLMKTYHNEANTNGITKIASKIFLEFFEQCS